MITLGDKKICFGKVLLKNLKNKAKGHIRQSTWELVYLTAQCRLEQPATGCFMF